MSKAMLDGYRDAVAAGASLHWLKVKAKVPVNLAWQSRPNQTWDELQDTYRDGYNIGLRTGLKSKTEAGYIHVIDLDITDASKAAEAHAALAEVAPGYEKLPTAISGSGGESRHYYFVSPEPLKTENLAISKGHTMIWSNEKGREVKKNDWEITLKGAPTSNLVLPPSIHPETGQPYRWLIPFPWDELDLGCGPTLTISTAQVSRPAADVSDDLLGMVLTAPLQIEQEELRNYLDDLPEEWVEDRDSWLKVGEALHHQFRGDVTGFKIWCKWSRQSEKFDLKDSRAVWKSFKTDARNPITFKTVIAAAQEHRALTNYQFGEIEDPLDDLLDGPSTSVAVIEYNPIDKMDEDEDWFGKLDKTDEGIVKPTMPNLVLILKNDTRLKGVIGYNQFTSNIAVRRSPTILKPKKEGGNTTNLDGSHWLVSDQNNGTAWQDSHLHDLRHLLERKRKLEGWGLKVADRDILAAIAKTAFDVPFHPILNMLESLPVWDRKQRVDRLWLDYMGAEDNPYHRKTATLFMVGAVARVYEPGCRFDNAPILEGVQGARKSTFIETLAMGFYGELGSELTDPKLFVESTDGKWILEIPELQGFNRHDIRELKSVMSRKAEQIRRPWARFSENVKRQNVMIGSTNDSEYLRDPTGGRRFWPIACNKTKRDPIDINGLKLNLKQLWAEALAMYRELRTRQPYGDLPFYLDDEVSLSISEELQASRTVETPEQALAGEIEMLLNEPMNNEFEDLDKDTPQVFRDEVCGKEIWIEVLGRSPRDFTKAATYEIADAMKFVKDWKKVDRLVRTKKYGPQRVYRRIK